METHISRLNVIVNEYLKTNEFQLVFSNFIARDHAKEKEKEEKFVGSFKEFWKSISTLLDSEKRELVAAKKIKLLGKFIERIQEQSNPQKMEMMFGLIRRMIDDNIIRARMVCEAVLKSGKLNFHNESSWTQSFEFVYALLRSIDYKGCRDIFTLVLEKSKDIPNVVSQPVSPQIDAVLKVIRLILDRNACLLPAYFCINEILKIYPEGKVSPHWITKDIIACEVQKGNGINLASTQSLRSPGYEALSKVLTDFVDGFRPLAHLVTVSGRCHLHPIIGSPCSSLHAVNSGIWRLDQKQLTFNFKVQLPYDKDISGRQYELLCNIMKQPHSRETVSAILSLNKTVRERCPVLDEILVDLVMEALEMCEAETSLENVRLKWQRLCGLGISYAIFSLLNFPAIISALGEKIEQVRCYKGRDYLMWFILQLWGVANTQWEFKDFHPLIKIIEFLYPDKKPLAVPDVNSSSFMFAMAVACLWNVISSKANVSLPKPQAITNLVSHLENVFKHCQHPGKLARTDSHTALLLNANTASTVVFVTELWFGKNSGQMSNQLPASHSTPIPLELLDLVTYPAKRGLIFYIGNLIKLRNPNATLSHVLLETYSRLLAENNIPGIRNVVGAVLSHVLKNKAWGILYNLLEMFSYRLPFIPQNYRIHLISHIHSIAAIPHTNQNYQLHLCLESTAFRLIQGLENHVVESYFTKHEANVLVSSESEELNRIFVLNIARAMHISGTEQHSSQWYEAIFKTIVEKTPMNWSKHTLEHFPYSIQQFFTQHSASMESKPALKQRVEDEYNKFKMMKSQAEILTYFGEPSPPNIFVCIIWKCLLETGRVTTICLHVLEKLGARALSKQIRVFADFLIHDYSLLSNGSSEDHNKRITCLHDMVWKYHIVSIDRLVLCLMLRYYESKEAQVCNLLLSFLLLKISTFRDRIHSFVQEVQPDYWKHLDWHQKHKAYHQKYGEKFYFEGLREAIKASSHNIAYLPVNFGNVCLRFLPVLDVVIHRFIELPPVSAGLESLLHNFGALYKFHDRPITYVYNTLYYYNHILNQRQASRKKLVSVIIETPNLHVSKNVNFLKTEQDIEKLKTPLRLLGKCAFSNIRPPNWCLSKLFLEYLNRAEIEWKPNLEYYCGIVGRLVDTISGNSPFPTFDLRFHEFSSTSAHALYVTCVELMCLPVNDHDIGKALFSVIYKCGETSRGFEILNNTRTWMNAVALIISSLPESYGKVVPQLVSEALTNDLSIKDVTPITANFPPENMLTPSSFSYSFYNFQSNTAACALTLPDLVVSFTNAVWYHSSLGHLSLIPGLLRDTFKPLIQNEAQFLFVCRLLGPFLFRFYSEKPRCLLEIAKELYAILDVVDKKCPHLYHIDTICDFFYHIKYMFVGDSIKQDIQHYIASLRPMLQNRMQFIAHVGHTREDTGSVSA